MRGNGISRGVRFAVAALSLAGAVTFSQSATAQTAYCWIDAKTGSPVATGPVGWSPTGRVVDRVYGNPDPNHVTGGGRTAVRLPDGSWIDAATGNPVATGPVGWSPTGRVVDRVYGNPDPNHVTGGGRTAVRVPCPPTSTASSTGLYLGGELAKNWGRVRSTESLATTDVITNRFVDSGDPLGVGIVAGYNFRPWNNNFLIGPFASFDWLTQTINHTFPTGFYLGTTTHWFANIGAKGGFVVTPGVYIYGLAGAAWLNHDLNISFAPGLSSQNTTTPGFTLGLGGEYQPSSWVLFGNPVSVFLQYQHTWWGTANFNTPAPASPTFNYAFKREDDTIKLGVNIHLSR